MTENLKFDMPAYAGWHAYEVVRSIYLEVWSEGTTRHLRIDVIKDLVGNNGPFTTKVYAANSEPGEFRAGDEFIDGDYPYWPGDSADEALEKCLDELGKIAQVSRGLEAKKRFEAQREEELRNQDGRGTPPLMLD